MTCSGPSNVGRRWHENLCPNQFPSYQYQGSDSPLPISWSLWMATFPHLAHVTWAGNKLHCVKPLSLPFPPSPLSLPLATAPSQVCVFVYMWVTSWVGEVLGTLSSWVGSTKHTKYCIILGRGVLGTIFVGVVGTGSSWIRDYWALDHSGSHCF